METTGSKLAKGITSLYLVQLLSLPLGFVTNLLAGNYLDPSDYGSYATAVFVVSLLGMLSDASLATALIRDPERLERGDFASVFGYQLVAGALLGGALLGGSYGIGAFFGPEHEHVAAMIRQLAWLPMLTSFATVPMVRAEREMNYGRVAGLLALSAILERLLLIGFMLNDQRGFSYVYARVLGVAIQGACLYLAVPWNPFDLIAKLVRDGWQGRRHLGFGLTLLVKHAASPAMGSVIPVIGGRLFSAEIVGLLAWSQNMASMVGLQLPQHSARVLIGASRQFEGDHEQIRRYVNKTLMTCTATVGVAIAVGAALMPELLEALFKPRWREAAPYFALASLGMGVAILSTIYDALLVVLGFPGYTAIAGWITAAAVLISGTVLARIVGPAGLLWGNLIGALAAITVMHFKVRAHCALDVVKSYLLPFAGGVAIYALILLTKGAMVHGTVSLLVAVALYSLVGLGLQLLIVPGFSDAVRSVMWHFFHNRKH